MAQTSSLTICPLAIKLQTSDQEQTTDLFVAEGANIFTTDGSHLTFDGSQNGGSFAPNVICAGTKVFSAFFRVPYSFFGFLPGGTPGDTEGLYSLQETLSVGLIDANNRQLDNQSLQDGDLLVLKDHVHYEINNDPAQAEVKALAAFSSSNPGLQTIPNCVFGSGINCKILAKGFNVNGGTFRELQAPYV